MITRATLDPREEHLPSHCETTCIGEAIFAASETHKTPPTNFYETVVKEFYEGWNCTLHKHNNGDMNGLLHHTRAVYRIKETNCFLVTGFVIELFKLLGFFVIWKKTQQSVNKMQKQSDSLKGISKKLFQVLEHLLVQHEDLMTMPNEQLANHINDLVCIDSFSKIWPRVDVSKLHSFKMTQLPDATWLDEATIPTTYLCLNVKMREMHRMFKTIRSKYNQNLRLMFLEVNELRQRVIEEAPGEEGTFDARIEIEKPISKYNSIAFESHLRYALTMGAAT